MSRFVEIGIHLPISLVEFLSVISGDRLDTSVRTFELHSYQNQVILGTMLGTSCVRKHPKGKNYSLYMRAATDLQWFRVKCKHLEEYARDPSGVGNTWESCSHQMWNDFRDLCYTNNKKTASMDWLNQLSSIGLSVWFLDKGGVSGNRAYIRIANLDNQSVVEQWFNEVGYECVVKKKMIVFDSDTSRKFLKAVTPCFPKYLLDRTNPYHVRKYL